MSPAGPIRLGGPRQRSVLALLLLDANRVVSIDRLVDSLYGDAPPISAVTQVHRQISELRALLEPDRPPGSPAGVIETRPPGYRVLVAPGGLDLERFEQMAEAAGEALERGDPGRAVAGYREALEVWQGEPLADLAFEPFARPVTDRLDELRLAVIERWLDAELELGRGAGLVPELDRLVALHPLNERLRGQLMVALYRAGRQPEALEHFRRARSALVEAFGIEPTPELKELEGRILAQDATLDVPGRASAMQYRPARRTVLLAARDAAELDALVEVGRHLAAYGGHELLITQAVEHEASLAAAVTAARERRDELVREGVTARAAAFVSPELGQDLARLALAHDADLVVTAIGDAIGPDGTISERLALLLERSPCDTAFLGGAGALQLADGVAVLFAGGEHDWAAAELGAWLAAGASAPLRLIGVRRPGGGDSSRLLASASIAIQQLVGIDVEPRLADPGPDGLLAAVRDAGATVVGLSPRWRREGLGESRGTLLNRALPFILAHRGARPGGLAPRDQRTRFTWTIAPGA